MSPMSVDFQENETNDSQRISCFFRSGIEIHLSQSGTRMLRIPVARLGTFIHPLYGIVTFSQRDFDDIQRNFADGEAGFTPWLRYGHSKLPQKIERMLADHHPKIANLRELYQEGDILFGIYEPLNQKVVEEVENGEYEGASCEVLRDAVSKFDGRPIGTLLTSHALTNSPFIPGMPANQVLSDNAGSSSLCQVLDMTPSKGDEHMDIQEMLSALAADDVNFEGLSVSKAQIDKVRAKLAAVAGTSADPTMKVDLPAGEAGPNFSAEKLSDSAAEGDTGAEGEALSNKGAIAKASAAIKDAGKGKDKTDEMHDRMKQKFSLGEFAAVFLQALSGGKGVEASKEADQNTPADTVQDGTSGAEQHFSAGAPNNSGKEGATDMGLEKDQVMALIAENNTAMEQKFSTTLAEKEQKFSEQMAAKEAEIKALKDELGQTKTSAEMYSNSLVDQAFETQRRSLINQGVPAVVVNKVAEVAKLLRGQEQKFSNGETKGLDVALFEALAATPGHLRVSFEQEGQQFSANGGQDTQTNAAQVFGDVVPGLAK